MKVLFATAIALMMLLSSAFAESFEPIVKIVLDSEKTIHVFAQNITDTDYLCKFNVSRFVNGSTWKNNYGTEVLRNQETMELIFRHDVTDRITLIRAKFNCR